MSCTRVGSGVRLYPLSAGKRKTILTAATKQCEVQDGTSAAFWAITIHQQPSQLNLGFAYYNLGSRNLNLVTSFSFPPSNRACRLSGRLNNTENLGGFVPWATKVQIMAKKKKPKKIKSQMKRCFNECNTKQLDQVSSYPLIFLQILLHTCSSFWAKAFSKPRCSKTESETM